MSKVASFEIGYTRYLDPDGNADAPLPSFAQDTDYLISLYRDMVLIRTFDTKAIALQRTGKLGTYPSTLGQEAVAVAMGRTMQTEDVFVPMYRECGTQFLRGVRMREILLYWGGDERGMDYAGPREDFPVSVPIATQVLHAVGVAYAFKYRKQPRVAVCVVGDGGTSKGDFYEAINAAGVWDLPVVFMVVNNQWAISVPRDAQSRAQTLAQKAIAAGMPGEQVDGNDAIAVHDRLGEAIARARGGDGPALIEALTYRLSDHTTADDASRYREADEVERYQREEPLARLRNFLTAAGAWDEEKEQRLATECAAGVEKEITEYLNTKPQPLESIFDFMFETPPQTLREQRDSLTRAGKHDA